MANHTSMRTTQLYYKRRLDETILDGVDKDTAEQTSHRKSL